MGPAPPPPRHRPPVGHGMAAQQQGAGSASAAVSAAAAGMTDAKAKTVLKEAVDAVVNSFAKHTHGYGRGKDETLFFITFIINDNVKSDDLITFGFAFLCAQYGLIKNQVHTFRR